MSVAELPQPAEEKKKKFEEREVEYEVLGGELVRLTIGMVRQYLTSPTKKGHHPTDADVMKFMMLCKARMLNPWEGDAYLLGYDTDDGPVFNLITSVQAMLKRAEACENFDGMESGIIVLHEEVIDGVKVIKTIERQGAFRLDNETVVGGWAKCYRKDRKISFYQSVTLTVYDTHRSRWKKDPAGMIQKVAKCAALRDAFPAILAGLKSRDEMERVIDGQVVEPNAISANVVPAKVKTAEDLTSVLKRRNEEAQNLPVDAESESLRDQLLLELKSANSIETVQSIEEDCLQLAPVDREFLLRETAAIKKTLKA